MGPSVQSDHRMTSPQPRPPADFTYNDLAKAISAPRAARYLKSAEAMEGESLHLAVELYQHNATLSAAAWSTIADMEVLLRNVVADSAHTRHSSVGRSLSERWYDAPNWFPPHNPWFTAQSLNAIKNAKRAVGDRGPGSNARPPEGRVVAGLSFGFWRFILSSRYEHSLWNPAVRRAFPGLQGLSGTDSRAAVYDRMTMLNNLRNRIGHHEPIYEPFTVEGRVLEASQVLHDGVELIEWTNPRAAHWIQQRITFDTASRAMKNWPRRT